MASGLLIYDQHKCLRVWMRVAQGCQVCAELCVFDAEQSSNCRIINVARDSTELHMLVQQLEDPSINWIGGQALAGS